MTLSCENRQPTWPCQGTRCPSRSGPIPRLPPIAPAADGVPRGGRHLDLEGLFLVLLPLLLEDALVDLARPLDAALDGEELELLQDLLRGGAVAGVLALRLFSLVTYETIAATTASTINEEMERQKPSRGDPPCYPPS